MTGSGFGRRLTCALAAAIVVLGASASVAAADNTKSDAFILRVLSNRADLISDGNALIGLTLPRGQSLSGVEATLTFDGNDRDVTNTFKQRGNGQIFSLLSDLELGRSVLEVSLENGRSRSVAITNHPNGGPVFSGPLVQPWYCQETAQDEDCNQPPTYEFSYMPTGGGGLQPYDPENPASDVATTTTDQGVEVPFIVREETGYQLRDQYKIATLYQPDMPWKAWKPQPQWNHKVLITHGASCGVTYETGTAPGVTDQEDALGRGFVVMSTALDNAGHNCNIATQAESLVMAKERIVEEHGRIRYTIGTGCSGGALTQQQVANAYPGIYQGILPQCSYPDAISTGIQFADYHGLLIYLQSPEAIAAGITPAQWGPIMGHISGANAVVADEAFFKNATNPQGSCVPEDVRYHPETNPGGVRCSLLDYMINIFGPRPQSAWSPMEVAAGKGFAGQPINNVGVQYGLGALQDGVLTTEQFVSLNEDGGGLDIDINPTEERTVGDLRAIRNSYRSGAINSTNHMDKVAIIDLRGPDPAIAHDAYRSWEVRARLDREHGTHANQVIWFGPTPLLGSPTFAGEALIEMDKWLSAVEGDKSNKPLEQKIIDNKPADLTDECEPTGSIVNGDCELITAPNRYGTPRTVAGDAITTDNAACRLKPLDRSSYRLLVGSVPVPIPFTEDQWSRMEAEFPNGVCDYSKPGVGQQDTIAWQTYQRADESVVYGGKALGDAPKNSGAGWTSDSFGGWVKPPPG